MNMKPSHHPAAKTLSIGILAIGSLIFGSHAKACSTVADPAFQPPHFLQPFPATRVLALPDGKFVRFRISDTLLDQPAGGITRYLADGTLDSSFQFSREYNVTAVNVGPDGKLVIIAYHVTYGSEGYDVGEILRLNDDGSIDPTFTAPAFDNPYDAEGSTVEIQPDGKVLVSGQFSTFAGQARPGIVRLLSNGTLDTSFASVPLISFGGTGFLYLNNPALQPDGKIIVFGFFDHIGNASFPNGVARLNADGSLDSSFQPAGFTKVGTAHAAVVQSDGKVVLGGRFTVSASFAANPTGKSYSNLPLIRLNSDGSADQTYGCFNPALTLSFNVRDLAIQSDGKIVATDYALYNTVFRFNSNGGKDTTFHQPVFSDIDAVPIEQVIIVKLQADGRILVSGAFTDVDNASPNKPNYGVVRLNTNGTVDSTLTTSHKTGLTAFPRNFLRRPDRSTYISGFVSEQEYEDFIVPNNFAKLAPDGSVDTSFNPFSNGPLPANFLAEGLVDLGDGSLFIYGFTTPSQDFAAGRLSPDGTQDLNFALDATFLDNNDFPTIPQPGKGVLTNDQYATAILNGTVVRRMGANGSLDPSFHLDPAVLAGIAPRDSSGYLVHFSEDRGIVGVQPDGKILYVYLVSETSSRLLRLNADGSLDGSFAAVTLEPLTTSVGYTTPLTDPQTGQYDQFQVIYGESVLDTKVQSDGSIVIAGPFKSVNGTPIRGLARLNANGSLDKSFQIGQGPAWTQTAETATIRPLVEQVALQADGGYLLAGTFEAFGGMAAPGLVSLHADGSVDAAFVAPVVREKNNYFSAVLGRQSDGSFLLSGPYGYPNDTIGYPSFVRLLQTPVITSALNAAGAQGQPFSYQVTADGAPASFDATSLPAGLSIDTMTGLISGTPTVNGTFTVGLSASNVAGTGTASLILQIAPATPPPTITSPLTAGGAVGQQFTYQFTASGATTLTVANLPSGLTFNSALGSITGTPAIAGTFSVELTASNSSGTSKATLNLTIQQSVVISTLHIVSGTAATGRTGAPFSFQVLAVGATSSVRYSANGLPADLSISSGRGLISGTPQSDGSYSVALTATSGSATASATLQLTFISDPEVPVITSGNTASVVPGQSFSYTITAPSTADASDPTVFTLIGTLPPGLTFDAASGTISGTYPGLSAQQLRKAAQVNETSDASGSNVLATVQLFATNSHGTTTLSLSFLLPPSTLANISSRDAVGTGDNVMIGGFIISGNAPKTVLVRAIGPSLAQYGVSGSMADPTLTLYDQVTNPSTIIGQNDDWQTTQLGGVIASDQVAAINASGKAPGDSHESAIIATLPPGAYTAILNGKGSKTGVALVEVYDLDPSSDSTLANISTRGQVLTGDNVLIGGFIIDGTAPKTVLVRAIGPDLSQYGVPGTLADPTLTLFDQKTVPSTMIGQNDDWQTTQFGGIITTDQVADITATGKMPNDSHDSAIIATLAPGAYTAVVQGKDGSIGVGLVEIYEIP